MKTRAKTNRSLGGIDSHLTHGTGIVIVGGDNDVHVLDDTLQETIPLD